MVAIFTGLGAGFGHGSAANLGGLGLLGAPALGRAGEGVSVNGETGALVLTQQDEFLAGLGVDVGVARTYNSVGALNENGDGWRQSTDRRMVLSGAANAAGSTVTQVLADGATILWSWNGAAYAASDLAAEDQTLSYSTGTSTWTWRDNRGHLTETYKTADSGYISTRSDDDGNTLAFAYVSAGKLDKVTTQDGSYIQYGWSGTDITQVVAHYTDLVSLTAKTLTRTRYGYDGQHRLTSVTVDLSPEDNAVADGKVYTTTYTYVGTTNYIASITQSDGSSLAISYDGLNRVSQLALTAATGDTRTTTFAYFSDHVEITDPRGQVTKVYFAVSTSGAIGELTKVIAPPATTGATGQTLQYTYDSAGRLLTVTDALGKVTAYAYDANGNVATITDPNGVVTTKSYDANNNLTLVTVSGSNADNASTSLSTRYVYDAENHLRFVISAEGRVQENRYNANGTLQYTLDYPDSVYTTVLAPTLPSEAQMATWAATAANNANAEICKYTYDARGNLTQANHYASSSGGVEATTDGYAQTTYVYDQAGRLLSQKSEPQRTLTYVYDGLGRLIAATDLNGGTTTIAFNDGADTTTVTTAANFTTVSAYNKAGELQSTTTSASQTAGGTQSFVYDKNGNVRKVTDATGKISYLLYDKAGRKIASIGQGGELVEYRYAADNRLIASVAYATTLSPTDLAALAASPAAEYEFGVNLTRPAAASSDLWSWTIYDAGGRVAETIAGDGAAIVYAYDGANRLIGTTAYANKLTPTQVSAFIATPPTTVTLPAADASRDVVVRTFYDGDGNVVGTLNAEGYLSQIIYDAAGRKVQTIAYATATTTTYRASGTFSQNLGAIPVGSPKNIAHFVYDGEGLLRYSIDALNHVTELVYRAGASDIDANGQVRATIQYAQTISPSDFKFATVKAALASIAGDVNNRIAYSVYDDSGRQAYSIDAAGGLVAYAYDTSGRVTQTTAYATAYTAANGAAALSGVADSNWQSTVSAWIVTKAGSGDRISHSYYDERGDVLFSADAEGYISGFAYDAEGRVVASSRYAKALSGPDLASLSAVIAGDKGTAVTTTYSYDAFGRVSDIYDPLGAHTQKTYYANGTLQDVIAASGQGRDESKTHTAYDQAGHVLEVTRAYGALEASKTTYAYDGLGNVASIKDGANHTTSFAYDKAGHVLSKTDAAGGVTQYQYDAFGNAVKTIDARGNASFAYYDQANRLVLSVDAENYATQTVYTAFGEVQSVTRYVTKITGAPVVGAQPTITINAADAATAFVYDKLGHAIQTTDAAGVNESAAFNAFGQKLASTNKLGAVTTYAYDHRGLLTSQTDPEVVTLSNGTVEASSVTTSFAYDSRGNRTQMLEAAGLAEQRSTTYTYDLADRLISQAGDAVSVAASATALAGSATPVTSYVYDRRGNVIQVTDPAGAKTFTWYDDLDRAVEEVSPLGTITTFTYDAVGNVTEKKIFATQISPPTDASGTAPNPAGDFRSTQYVYDNVNRLTQVTTPNIETASFTSAFTVTTAALTTTYQYDAMGNVVKTTDANGAITWAYFDKAGNKTTQIDALNYRTDWSYDTNSNVLTETRYANAGTTPSGVTSPPALPTLDNANDRITIFTYDKMGRRLTETRGDSVNNRGLVAINNSASPGTTTNVAATITYTYNALGEVATKTEATGETTAYTYDSMGRMTGEAHASFTDVNGNVATPTLNYSYDGLGNVVRTVDIGKAGAIAAADRVTVSTYDKAGRLATNTDASGALHTYVYDAAGRRVRDEYWRTTPATNVLEAIGADYDAEGHVIRQGVMVYSGGAWSRAGAGLDTQAMSYNAFGEIAQRGYFHDISGAQTTLYDESFSYDLAGRLWAATGGDGTTKYFMYDANGNQTLMVASSGADIAGKANIDAVLDLWGATRANVGTTYVAGVIAAITRYDGRNQAIEVKEPQREVSGATKYDLSTTRAYNAFGETAYEIDANGNRIDYSYNTMGRLIQTQSPAVQGVGANGLYITGYSGFTPNATSATATTFRPVEYKYYDASGRLAAQRDANGNLTQYTLLAGSGYGGAQALTTQVKTADNAVVATLYDIHGDARVIRDQLWTSGTTHADVQSFDGMGRLTELDHSGGLIDFYQYDELGQRIRITNNLLGAANAETTTYDQEGRVVQSVAFGGDATAYAYAWDGAIADMGLTLGGWTTTTTAANGKTKIEKDDAFDRVVQTTDMAGAVSATTYDHAGRATQRTGGSTQYYAYFNTGRLSEAYVTGDDGYGTQYTYTGIRAGHDTVDYRGTTFSYDKNGNLLTQTLRETGIYYQDPFLDSEHVWEYPDPAAFDRIDSTETATYDALNRISTWSEIGAGGFAAGEKLPNATHTFVYDANGNIRRSLATYYALNSQGAAAGSTSTQDYWYKYDSLNRMTTSQGVLSGGAISRGTTGVDIVYDYRGNRLYTIAVVSGTARRDDYVYDAADRVTQIKSGTTLTAPNTLRSDFSYDLMGRMILQHDYATNGTSVVYSDSRTLNDKGQVTSESVSTVKGSTTYLGVSTYTYGSGSTYALGSPLTITTVNYENGVQKKTNLTTNSYIWSDGPQQWKIDYTPDTSAPTVVNHTIYGYDTIGGQNQLGQIGISDGRPRTVQFRNDFMGQGIRRDETDNITTAGDPHELWYRFSGREMIYVGNNGTVDTDEATSISNRTASQGTGAFFNGASSGTSFADSDLAYDSIDSYDQGSTGGMYTVRDGDTLAGIAASLWGDASLWYKIAELNGLTADSALPTGMPLLIPVGVIRSTNNAATYKPYDPAEIVGNTMPTAVKPPKSKHNCGVLGQIVLVVIAAVVAFYTAGATAQFFAGAMNLNAAAITAAGEIATGTAAAGTVTGASLATLGAAAGGAAVGGAVGSVVSQVVGVATGIQDKFSWNAVGLAAIGAAAGVGTAKVIPGTSNFAAAERGMANSAITQGIGVATGMQKKFSWAAVAAAGVGSAAGNEFRHDFGSGIADALGARSTDAVVAKSAQYATSGIVAMVDAIAGAGARTLIEGTDFGDNVLAALPDAIGSTIGNALAQGIKAQFEPQIEVAEVTPDHIDQLDFGPPIDIASLVPKLDLTQFNRTMAAITARQRNATDLPIWARHDIFQNWSLFEASTNSASPTPNVRSDNFHAGDTSLFGHEGPFATYFHRLDQTASTLRQADLALTAADSALEAGDWPAFALNEAHGVLLTLGGFGQASTWPLTGSLDALGQSLGHSPARAEYDSDFVVGTSMAMWSATSLAAAPGRIPIAGDSDFIGPLRSSNWNESVAVFRVEGAGNQRVVIGGNGSVEIPKVLTRSGDERNLFLNFGDYDRALEFQAQHIEAFPDTTIKSFQVPRSFLDDLRTNAVTEPERSLYPDSPVVVDTTKAVDQYGLSGRQIDQLRQVIIQGSGRPLPTH
ncbi:MAG: LysM peptidoglycan-binding domain-containing protein [Terricaulis sp.]